MLSPAVRVDVDRHARPCNKQQQQDKARSVNQMIKVAAAQQQLGLVARHFSGAGEKERKKSVSFDSSIDWEQEDCRSCRGFEVRREKKRSKQMEYKHCEERQTAFLEILSKEENHRDVCLVCENDRRFKLSLQGLFGIVLNGDYEYVLGLTAFRTRNVQLDNLDNVEKSIVSTLLLSEKFMEVFGEGIPSQVVSGGSDEEGRGGERAARKRDRNKRWTQKGESKKAKDARKTGARPGDGNNGEPNTVETDEFVEQKGLAPTFH